MVYIYDGTAGESDRASLAAKDGIGGGYGQSSDLAPRSVAWKKRVHGFDRFKDYIYMLLKSNKAALGMSAADRPAIKSARLRVFS